MSDDTEAAADRDTVTVRGVLIVVALWVFALGTWGFLTYKWGDDVSDPKRSIYLLAPK